MTGYASIGWHGSLQSPQQLSAIIAGEAPSASGQFAVASVMYNRLNSVGSGYAGYGTDSLSSVVTPTQFNGYQPQATTPYTDQLANELWNGQAPSGGSTGNAVFYSNPDVPGVASWTQGLRDGGANIDGNYFSDQPGAPSSNFQAPSYDGSSVSAIGDTGGAAGISNISDGSSSLGITNISGGVDTSQAPSSFFDTSGGVGAVPNADDTTGVSTIGSSGSSLPTFAQGDAGLQQALGADESAGTVSSSLSFAGGGPPVEVTNISSAGQQAGQEVQQGVQNAGSQISKSVTSGVQSIVTAAGNLLNAPLQGATDLFVRFSLVLFALVILVGAWFFFMRGDDNGKLPVIVAA